MGLDQYLDRRETIADWRKHPNLHGWFEQRWRAETHSSEEFNCKDYCLDEEDIVECIEAVKSNSLPHTEGFFFGDEDEWSEEEREEQKQEDLEILEDALQRKRKGQTLVYSAWY